MRLKSRERPTTHTHSRASALRLFPRKTKNDRSMMILRTRLPLLMIGHRHHIITRKRSTDREAQRPNERNWMSSEQSKVNDSKTTTKQRRPMSVAVKIADMKHAYYKAPSFAPLRLALKWLIKEQGNERTKLLYGSRAKVPTHRHEWNSVSPVSLQRYTIRAGILPSTHK